MKLTLDATVRHATEVCPIHRERSHVVIHRDGPACADARCARIANRQFGVLSRVQALDAGMSEARIRSRLSAGRWEVVMPSVYKICGAPFSQLQHLMAAQLYGGPGTVVVGRSAAAAWGLEGGRLIPAEVSSPRQLVAGMQGLAARRCRSLEPSDITTLDGLPLTNRVRTLIDMSASVHERALDIAVDQVLRAEPSSLAVLLRRMEELRDARLRGMKRLRLLVAERDPRRGMTASELETLVRRWLSRFGFPEPVFQHPVVLPHYGPARLDFAYPDKRVGLEADSYAWHSGREAFERDRARISEFASLGWIIIQTTAREIERYPARPAARLHRALLLRV